MPKRRMPRHPVTQPSDQSYRIVPLTQGLNAIVDTQDFEWLSRWNWYAQPKDNPIKFYAARKPRSGIVYMHRVLLSCKPTDYGDHRDGNSLDNRRHNLRKCTNAQNCFNRGKNRNNVSGFKGVFWNTQKGKWNATLHIGKRRVHCGFFESPKEAAHAYDEAAKKYYGEFAHLNFSS